MSYEIDPVRFVSEHGVERCEPEQADAWGLYRRLPPDEHGHRLAEWVSDHPTAAAAKEAKRLLRLAGRP